MDVLNTSNMQVRAMKTHLQALLRKGGNDDRLIAMLQASFLNPAAYSQGHCPHRTVYQFLMQYITMAMTYRQTEVSAHPFSCSRNVQYVPCCIITDIL